MKVSSKVPTHLDQARAEHLCPGIINFSAEENWPVYALTLPRLCSLLVFLCPTPSLTLLSLFHSPNINRVIWMSWVPEKSMMSAALQTLKSTMHYSKMLQFSFQLHATNSKTILFSWQERSLDCVFLLHGGPPQLVFLWPVVITGAMSIYNFLYYSLLKRMTNCWLTPLTGILHLHR